MKIRILNAVNIKMVILKKTQNYANIKCLYTNQSGSSYGKLSKKLNNKIYYERIPILSACTVKLPISTYRDTVIDDQEDR